MLSKRGFSRRPLTTFRRKGSQHNGSTQRDKLRRHHTDTKKTGVSSTSTYHARTDCAAPPSGSNAWTGEKSPAIPKTTPQGIFPSSPTYMPQKCITMTTTKTPLGHYPHGLSPPSAGVGPHSPCSTTSLTSSLFTIGASWLKSIGTG